MFSKIIGSADFYIVNRIYFLTGIRTHIQHEGFDKWHKLKKMRTEENAKGLITQKNRMQARTQDTKTALPKIFI
jgi:hypothetical protein